MAVVESFAKKLAENHPEANREVVLLSVWFHDLGRAYGHHKDHHQWGAKFARKYLAEQGLSQEIIEGVEHACLAHRVKKIKPETVEAKILATADALSHFKDAFYLRILNAWSLRTDLDYFKMKQRLFKKIKRDFNQKIFFKEAKDMVREEYRAWMKIFNED